MFSTRSPGDTHRRPACMNNKSSMVRLVSGVVCGWLQAHTSVAGMCSSANSMMQPILTNKSLMTQPPNAFSNELGQWLYDEFKESVVIIEFRPKSPTKVEALWDKIDPIPRSDQQARDERTKFSKESGCSTGFVVKDDGASVWLLTCAHGLGPAFNAKNPITRNQVQDLFEPWMVCDHCEYKFRTRKVQEREYLRAVVAEVNCAKDLLLLSVPRARFVGYCKESHRPIPFAASYPRPLQGVAMLSWPPMRPRTAVWGSSSHRSRTLESLSSGNPRGYKVRLAEVDITSEDGSSGAPLLNGAGEFIAVLHGGFGGRFSFFVSFMDVMNTLKEWGVID